MSISDRLLPSYPPGQPGYHYYNRLRAALSQLLATLTA